MRGGDEWNGNCECFIMGRWLGGGKEAECGDNKSVVRDGVLYF